MEAVDERRAKQMLYALCPKVRCQRCVVLGIATYEKVLVRLSEGRRGRGQDSIEFIRDYIESACQAGPIFVDCEYPARLSCLHTR